jgi:predicted SAM-dependent methyltransferase
MALAARKWQSLSRASEIRLELRSGRKNGNNGYTTVDLYGADIYRDLRKGIPLLDDSVSEIYTSHMFERIPFGQLISFLNECRRVMMREGKLSVFVPNARNYIEAYIEDRHFRTFETPRKPAITETGSFLDQLNYIAYMGGEHCYLFEEENFINTLD